MCMGAQPCSLRIYVMIRPDWYNREVADRMVISEYAARNMVSNILGKLGLSNRSELVRWAFEHDLKGHAAQRS